MVEVPIYESLDPSRNSPMSFTSGSKMILSDSEYSLAFLPKVEISLWVDDSRAEEIVRRIVEIARTGRMGDGKIFVLPAQITTTVIDIDENNR